MGARVILRFCFMLCLLVTSSRLANAQAISIFSPNFNSSAGWQLNGQSAVVGVPGYLRLTQNLNNQAGTAFWKKKIGLGADFSFSTYFTFKMTPGSRADGITFCVQQAANTAGGSGGGIGYAGIPGKSIAVEYDTYTNGGDPNNNHIAFDQDGKLHNDIGYAHANASPYVNNAPLVDLADGQLKHNWIDYNGVTNVLEVRISTTSVRPNLPTLSIPNLDLATIFPNSDVFFGFTAATGGSTEEHAIYSLYAINAYNPFPSDPANGGYQQGIANVDVSSSNDIDCVHTTTQLTIHASDALNAPLAGRTLNVALDSGTGILSATSVTTDVNGNAVVLLSNVTSPNVVIRAYDPAVGAYGTARVDASSNWTNVTAEFDLVNGSTLCSNQTVRVINKSFAVSGGTVSRLEWYVDYLNNPSSVQVDLAPVADKVYDLTYPSFYSPGTQNYSIRLVAFSNGACSSAEKTKIITLKAVPEVKFDPLVDVCSGTPSYLLTASELRGFTGAFAFSGSGVSANGLFNPQVAGVGLHDINYTFTAQNTCSASAVQSIRVLQRPTVSIGNDTVLVAGNVVQLQPQISGSVGMSYSWSPILGLSNPSIANPSASPQQSTTYQLLVSDSNGCSAADNIVFTVLQLPEIPNAFTPNGDGINDVWNIRYLADYTNADVEVYDRYGQKVFYSKGYAGPWDGTYNGSLLPMATYYYVLNLGFGMKPLAGSITIIR